MAITALPTPPTRSDPTNFAARADALMVALPTFVTEANALQADVNAKQSTASSAATNASISESNASTSAANAAASASSAINAPGTNATSSTSLTISTGSQIFTLDQTGKAFSLGQQVIIANTATPTNYMAGTITAFTSGTGAITVSVNITNGSGTFSSWTISLTSPTALSLPNLTLNSGSLNFSGTSQRISGDFSNATVANRVMFQTSTVNGNTTISTIPNGTGTASGIGLYSKSDVTNSEFLTAYVASGSAAVINADKTGTGAYLPMLFYTGGSERMRIGTTGNVTLTGNLDITGNITKNGNPLGSLPYSARTSNTALVVSDQGSLIDITSGTFTQTLVAAATLGNGWWCYIRNSGTGDVTLDPNASETIDGLTSYVMYPGEVRLVQCDGVALRSVVIIPFNKTFTSSGTFVTPPGYQIFSGLAWGAGGGGSMSSGGNSANGGGGGACVPFTLMATSLAVTETVTIGSGGTGPTSAGAGGNGGNTTFNIVTAYGGGGAGTGTTAGVGGGQAGAGTGTTPGGPLPGTSSIVDSSFGGAYGAVSTTAAGKSTYGGGGGATYTPSTANAGSSVYGGGGGGTNGKTGGTSQFGGAGGGHGAAGTAPAGGGGGGYMIAAGAGARGELRIWGAV